MPPNEKKCESCGVPLSDRTARFCQIHAREFLIKLEAVGYLEPLEGISPHRFLTLGEQPNPPIPNSQES